MHHLEIDEIKKLLNEIPQPRQRTMIKVALLHGLRVSELITLRRENIRDGYVNVQRLKGSLKTVQPFVASSDPDLDESQDLRALYVELQPKEILFPMSRNGVYKLMQRAGQRAGIPAHKLHPHALKHSCAMTLVGVMPINDLQTYLGHKSLASTGEYTKSTDEKASALVAKVFA
jgi:integrase/recombinase XerD